MPDRHGGDLAAHLRRHPRAPRPPLDLSTGINPFAWPDPAPLPPLPPEALLRLPAPDALRGLERAACRRYAHRPGGLVAVPGTAFGLAVLAAAVATAAGRRGPRARPRAAILGPGYGGHHPVLRAAGFAVSEVADLGAALAGDPALVVACRPNNPDGRVLPADELREAAAALAGRGGLLVVDEAFADLEPCGGELIAGGAQAGLALARSFGKAWGLPGLRLAFVAAAPPLARALRAAAGAWPVSGPAVAIGAAALSDPAWLRATGARLDAAGDALDAALARAGFAPAGRTRLFRLVRHARAPAIADALGGAGIMVRAFGRDPALLRFGIPGGAAALARLEAGLAVKALESRAVCR